VIAVGDVREAQAAVLAFKAADRDLRKRINTATRETMNPVWRSLVDEHASSPIDKRVLAKGARVAAGNPPTAIAASSRRPLSGGFIPADDWPGREFGANRNATTTYTRRSPAGTTHQVTRHTRRQLPARNPSGRVVYAAVRKIAPRLASLWVQLIVRTYYDAADGKG
jgi:hypothetical protein